MEEDHDALEGIDRPPKKKVTFQPARSKYSAEEKAAIRDSAFKIAEHEARAREREAKEANAMEVTPSSEEEEFK